MANRFHLFFFPFLVSSRVFCHYRALYIQNATVKSTNFAPAATSLANELHGGAEKARGMVVRTSQLAVKCRRQAYLELPALSALPCAPCYSVFICHCFAYTFAVTFTSTGGSKRVVVDVEEEGGGQV